jgi:hypothetical protein
MTKFLKIIGIVGAMIPIVLSLVKEFETPGFGAEKKKVVLDAIVVIYDKMSITVIAKEKLLGIAGSIIDIAVAFFNVVGWFKNSNPTDNT